MTATINMYYAIVLKHAYCEYSLPKQDMIHSQQMTLLMKQTLY